MLAMRSQGNDDGDVAVRYAGGIQFIQQGGQKLIMLDPGTGNITDDNNRFVAGFDNLPQRRRADRMVQGMAHSRRHIADRRGRTAVNLLYDLRFRQVKRNSPLTIAEFDHFS